jgi:hypothetical protein
MARYTFRMRALTWLLVLGVIIGNVYSLVLWRRRWEERQRVAEERFTAFIAQAKPAVLPPVAAAAAVAQPAPQERLLLEAAGKAGEAGEPALSIQLYAKLLSRYPQTRFAAQARAAVDEQKKKLAKA